MKGTFEPIWKQSSGQGRGCLRSETGLGLLPESSGSLPLLDPPPWHLNPGLWARLKPVRRHAVLSFSSGVGWGGMGWGGHEVANRLCPRWTHFITRRPGQGWQLLQSRRKCTLQTLNEIPILLLDKSLGYSILASRMKRARTTSLPLRADIQV